MSTLIADEPRFEYPGLHPDRPARCHLRLYDQGFDEDGRRGVVLLATDLGPENPGASVTNTVEAIATAACRRFGLDPERLTVVEHYDDRAATRAAAVRDADLIGRVAGEAFAVVTFRRVPRPRRALAGAVARWPHEDDALAGDVFGGPSWKHVTKRGIEALIGQALP